MAALCRFCLQEEESPNNPLLQPCACKGSAAYVHAICIQLWRKKTTNPVFAETCQVCLIKYRLPRLFQVEIIPNEERTGLWVLLSKSCLMWILSLVLRFFCYVWLIVLFELVLAKRFLYFSDEIMTDIDRISSIVTCNVVSLLYYVYYRQYVQLVQNRRMYLQHWRLLQLRTPQKESPVLLLVMTTCCFCLSSYYPLPFYILYLYLLPRFFFMHRAILLQMNETNRLE
jgi:hypothetical protein